MKTGQAAAWSLPRLPLASPAGQTGMIEGLFTPPWLANLVDTYPYAYHAKDLVLSFCFLLNLAMGSRAPQQQSLGL